MTSATLVAFPPIARARHVALANFALCAALALLGACTRPRLPVAPMPAPTPSPVPTHDATAAAIDRSLEAEMEYLRGRQLIIPVAGVHAEQLSDSYDEPRDGSRRHRAIDILAPRGTPVLAADDGRVLRTSWNSAGGNTVYAVDPESRVVYYYAHLDHYRDSLAPGRALVRGDTIGFVGTTGNAPKDIPHLHFQIMRMPRDGKYWNGDALNPFVLFREQLERVTGAAKPER
jgi:murein DD-endopeptidase MepM/ murein hydrolase activator NlpD